jgi:hypothetical protein
MPFTDSDHESEGSILLNIDTCCYAFVGMGHQFFDLQGKNLTAHSHDYETLAITDALHGSPGAVVNRPA